MSKYDFEYGYGQNRPPVVAGETVLMSIKPKKNAFVLNKVLGMMPVALIWLAFDSVFIGAAFSGGMGGMSFVIVPFMLLHLMPVWIWLGNVLTANRRWKNTVYYLTDRRIIIQTGAVDQQTQTVYYKDIRNADLRIGIVDRLLGVGDIYLDTGDYHVRKGRQVADYKTFLDIENPQEVYARVQKIIMDIQADIEFPNAYRPEDNPGYNTKYSG